MTAVTLIRDQRPLPRQTARQALSLALELWRQPWFRLPPGVALVTKKLLQYCI